MKLLGAEARLDKVELDGGLLDALAEVALVEREPQLAVFENVVGTRLIVPSASCFLHLTLRFL